MAKNYTEGNYQMVDLKESWLPTDEERLEILKRHEYNSGEMRDELIKFTAKKLVGRFKLCVDANGLDFWALTEDEMDELLKETEGS